MKVRYLLVSMVIIVLLFTLQAYQTVGNDQVNIAGGEVNWRGLAENAWEYFQPAKGVDATTGLHCSCIDWPYFTDWDLGLYIQTIIDAEKLGILNRDGVWGADARLEKVLTFLEGRELTVDGLPCWWYESRTGRRWGDGSPHVADSGKLLVALQNLKLCRPDLAGRINYVVYEKTNYTSMWKAVDKMAGSTGIYQYYVASGFAGFWPERFSSVAEAILNNIVLAPKVETYGVELPVSKISCDPLFHSVFELKPEARLQELGMQVYLAHEARYNATGEYVAFSEGNTDLNDPSYAYEWVVLPDGRTWVIKNHMGSDVQMAEIIYFKVAVGFLATYNTEFAQKIVEYLMSHISKPTSGYMDGVDENGRLVTRVTDKTNGLIISAARYAIENSVFSAFPWQNSDLTVTPTVPTPTSSPTSTPKPEPTPAPVLAKQLTIELMSPSNREQWTAGTMRSIKWNTNGGTDPLIITLEYSTIGIDGPWIAIATGIPNNGSLAWKTPNTTATVYIRAFITDSANPPQTASTISSVEITGANAEFQLVLIPAMLIPAIAMLTVLFKRRRTKGNSVSRFSKAPVNPHVKSESLKRF